ncbi:MULTISPECIES: DUF4007 family protein [Segatella]|jgi:hypothetical protein|uniref:Uncharacterized protein n=2 Tax=Segatella TaxID=2974251 RepID=D8DTU4_9BACT|nr:MULTISPECIES: DUF4007 family protein [Segatella]EFI73154.1 conserved hypothetical protein [Segatella baroniae B14]UKK79508.1 DUF4007 family protein [Segatella baroniae B14]SEA61749.1 Protein of unknown function [Segatella bryantii]SEQ71218.1 Protein of unknown function [Segatella baroniae B14]GJG28990.1 hypothetical protein PRRU23_26900 [Segatella bryantii]
MNVTLKLKAKVTTCENKFIFSGHESFSCKALWLKKGYDFVVNKNNFNNADAVIKLGVGKNMVSSIRYWLRVFGICENDMPTKLGDYLFNDNSGKDKYMEDLATIWILHFNLVFSKDASLYNMFFCGLQRERTQFEREQIQTYIKLKVAEAGKQNNYNVNTVKKDISVLLQNYCLPRNPQSNEDFSSLLIELDLIRQSSDGKSYYFNVDGKRKVSKEIFLYGLLKLKQVEGDNTIAFETIQENVGLVFCMQDFETIEMLKKLSNEYRQYFTYSDVAGIKQIQFIRNLEIKQVLDKYYGRNI